MRNEGQSLCILAVEDDDVDHLVLQRALKGGSINATLERVSTLEQASAAIGNTNFDCVLLDYHLPDGSGLDFLEGPGWVDRKCDPAVIMLTGVNDIEVAVAAMKLGAQDFLSKADVTSERLNSIISKALDRVNLHREVKDARKKVEELAFSDTLTGLPNRNVFEDRLEQLICSAKRGADNFMIGVLDLNDFKAINDNLGHQAGDIVLRTVACRMISTMRDSDTVARFGGDEFVMLLPQAVPSLDAEVIAARILSTVANPIVVAGEEIFIGISIGLSAYPDHGRSAETLIRHADDAMYQAKINKTGWRLAQEQYEVDEGR